VGFEFGAVLVFALVAIAFALGGITLSRLVGPRFPNPEKASIYECGERPIGSAWFNFNPRFYLVALVFVVFEVEIALTFPVVVVYRAWVDAGASYAWVAFGEIAVFTAILVAGLAWAWAHGDLDWVKELRSEPRPPRTSAPAAPGGGDRRAA
jgi:NADH-quinone oxidoreductase subunit A